MARGGDEVDFHPGCEVPGEDIFGSFSELSSENGGVSVKLKRVEGGGTYLERS